MMVIVCVPLKKKPSPTGVLAAGITFCLVSLLLGHFVIPAAIKWGIWRESQLVPGEDNNTRYENWEFARLPLLQRIYLFNVTNPEEVVLRGGKPVLQQVGPIVYQFTRQKTNVSFNPNNGTVFYRERLDYYHRPDLSSNPLSDWITFLNIPFMGIAQEALRQGPVARYMINEVFGNYPPERMYVNKTLDQILFGGYPVPFIKEFSELHGEQILPNNTFGLYHGQNGSDKGLMEMMTGATDASRFGEVVTYNKSPTLDPWWHEQHEGQDFSRCRVIRGNDGGMFQPFTTNDRVFEFFTPGLCRAIRFAYGSDGLYYVKGVPVVKFPLDPTFLQSAKSNPDNECYCADSKKGLENCPDDGIFQMAGCGRGPMALSLPHFYNGDPIYVNQSVGLNPTQEQHEWAIYVEKYTSSPIKVSWRFQMNFELSPNKFFKQLKSIPKMMHPLFWIDQSVELPDEHAALLRDKLYGTLVMAHVAIWVGLVGGGVISIVALFYWRFRSTSSSSFPFARQGRKPGGGGDDIEKNGADGPKSWEKEPSSSSSSNEEAALFLQRAKMAVDE